MDESQLMPQAGANVPGLYTDPKTLSHLGTPNPLLQDSSGLMDSSVDVTLPAATALEALEESRLSGEAAIASVRSMADPIEVLSDGDNLTGTSDQDPIVGSLHSNESTDNLPVAQANDAPIQALALTLLPDLVGQFGTITLPQTLTAGGQGQVPVNLTNQGVAPAIGSPAIDLYFSSNTTLDANDVSLTRINTNSLLLLVGQSQTYSDTVTVPTNLAAGAYYLLAKIDATSVLLESNETNNLVVSNSTFTLNPPVTVTAALANDTAPNGTTNTDRITADAAITGSVSTLGNLASLKAGFDSTSPSNYVSIQADLTATGSFTLNRSRLDQIYGGVLPDGEHTLHLQTQNTLGTVSTFDLTFTLDTLAPTSLTVSLDPAFDTAPLGDGRTLADRVTLSGQTETGAIVSLQILGNTTTANSTGQFQFTDIDLALGANSFTAQASDIAGNVTSAITSIIRSSAGDVVTDWNTILLNAIQTDKTPPPLAARNMAIVQASVFDAINAIDQSYTPYYISAIAPDGASIEAAAVGAAYYALVRLYPAQKATFDTALAQSLAAIPDGQSKIDGLLLGQRVADAIVAWRQTDGSDRPTQYTPGTAPGDWNPTLPGNQPALASHWGTITPFALTEGDQFRPDGPPALSSADYTSDFNQVKELGQSNSTTRTAEQTQIAQFWADGTGTYTPAGHWNQIAKDVSLQEGNSIVDNARLFAFLDIGLADAGIASWDAKYSYNFWRPVTAIRQAGSDGNPLTQADPNWTPLLTTPPFPDYVSGHSTYSGTADAILTNLFGNNLGFTSSSVGLPNVSRTFANFTTAADEAGMSRIYGGIHFGSANQDGLSLGRTIGSYVVNQVLDDTPVLLQAQLANDTAPQGTTNTDTFTTDPAIAGRVLDLSRLATLKAGIDAMPETSFVDVMAEVGSNGNFTLTRAKLEQILGTALTDGRHTVYLQATDPQGQQLQIQVGFTLDTTAPTVQVEVPLAEGSHSDRTRLIGAVSDAGSGASPIGSVVLDNQTATPLTIDAQGEFDQALSNSPLTLGAHQVALSAFDRAGNLGQTSVDFQVTADFVVGPNGSIGWGAKGPDSIILGEQNSFVVQTALAVELGQAAGSRKLRFEIESNTDTTDTTHAIEDQLLVYLVDPANPSQTLVDRGEPGTALFSLAGTQAEFTPGLVRFDGAAVEIDLTSLKNKTSGLLVVQLVNLDGDINSVVKLHNFTNAVDPTGVASPTFSRPVNRVNAGGAINTATLTPTADLQLQWRNVHLDATTGRYVADLSVRNLADPSGRQVVVALPNLPAGVQVLNPSGVDANGIPYINLQSAIPPGGLDRGASSDVVQVVIENPNLVQFDLQPTVLVGAPNQAPVFNAIGSLSVLPGDTLEVPLVAIDPDGDRVTFSIRSDNSLPHGTLRADGTLVFTPKPEEVGTYAFTMVATDGALTTEQTVTLTVATDPVITTRISGIIQNTDQLPLAGVVIDLGGTQVTTASNGSFLLEFTGELPSDTLKVHGEGISGDYPFIAEKLPLVLGHEVYNNVNNVISRPIYLPPIDVANAEAIDPDVDILVTTDTISGASVFVAAGSLLDQQGDFYTGGLSITEVPTDLTPAALPSDLKPDLVVTIQPGEMVFTQPAPLALPNRAGYAPGQLMDLWSINPTTGDFDKVGVGQVSADGTVVETIEGGIRNSSWHFFAPPIRFNSPEGNPHNPDVACHDCQTSMPVTSSVELHSGAVTETHDLVSYQSLGSSRGLTLSYDSLRADPRPIVHFGYDGIRNVNSRLVGLLSVNRNGFEYQVPGFAGGQYGLEGGEHIWAINPTTRRADASIQADLSDLASGKYQYTLRSGLYQQFDDQFGGSLDRSTGEFLHVNRVNSAFGSGWGLAGLQELVENEDGSILLIDGDGSELLFQRNLDGTYSSPTGDFSTLERLANNTFRRTLKDQTVYQFNVQHQLVSMQEANGDTTQYVYNTSGKLSKIIDPAGLETTFTYTGDRISAITDPANRVTQLEYDAAGNLIRIVDPDTTSRSWEYDRRHHMTAETNQRGDREETLYNFAGRATMGIRKDGSVIGLDPVQTQGLLRSDQTSDPMAAPTAATLSSQAIAHYVDGNGNVSQMQLDRAGQAINRSDGGGALPTTIRNANNLVSTSTDALGNTTIYSYDDRGNVTTVQEELTLEVGAGATTAFSRVNNSFTGSTAIVVGDINGDGLPDIAAKGSNGQVVFHLGNGDGTFRLGGSVVSEYPNTLTLADTNRDGLLDLITGHYSFNNNGNEGMVSVWMGNGNGTFATRTDFAVLYEPTAIRTGDVNGDGFLDLVTFNSFYSSDNVSVLLGDGATFAPAINSQTGQEPEFVELVDLNGDGRLDLVTAEEGAESIAIQLGSGDGTFGSSNLVSLNQSLESIALGDVDADGDLDLLVGYGYAVEGVELRLGNGDGSFGVATTVSYAGGVSSVKVGDVTGDGKADLLVSDGRNAAVLPSNGNGTFAAAIPLGRIANVNQASLADLDRDGDPDVATASANGIYLNGIGQVQVKRQYVYDPTFNQVIQETDELGRITLYSLDPLTGDRRSMTRVVGTIGGSDDVVALYTYVPQGQAGAGQLDTETDPLGRVTDYDYDAFGRVTKITVAKGTIDEAVQQFEYDAAGNQTARIDENGNRTEYVYDAMNRLVKTIEADPDGVGELTSPVTSYTYDAMGNQVTMTDANGNVTRSVYDDMNRLVQTIEADPDGNGGALSSPVTTYVYDQSGNQVAMIDPLGRETRQVYDSRNRLMATIRPDGSVIQQQYDADNQRTTETDANGNQTRSVYDERGRLVRRFDADNKLTTFIYDAANQLVAQVDANNHRTEYEYDDLGRQVTVTDPRGETTTIEYDENGNVIFSTDRLNHTTQYQYDHRDRLIQTIDPLNHSTTTTYDDVGNVTSVTDALNHTTSYSYDALNRRVSVTDALNHTATMAYDAVGNQVSMIDPLNRKTTYTYDKLHRLITTIDPLNHSTTQTYDAVDNLIAVTDPLGHTTRYGYDVLNRRTSVTDALGATTTTAYDFNGNAISITDPNNNTTTYTYDKLDRLSSDTNTFGKTRSYDYDAVGNLVSLVDRNGRIRTFAYNENDWRTTEQWLDENSIIIRTIASTYDDEGKLTSISDPDSTYSYNYDAADRLTAVDNGGTSDVPQVMFTYEYDNANRLTTVTDTIAGTLQGAKTHIYDNANRLTQITQSGNGVTDKRVNMSYDNANQIDQLSRYSDLSGTQLVAGSDYTFDDAGRLVQLTHQGTTPIANYEFDYDDADRLTLLTSPDGSSNYSYDDRSQLTGTDHSDQLDEDYDYDANGNRTNTGYQTGNNNQLLSDGIYNYEYDNEGNRTKRIEIATGNITEYTWDYRNRLVQLIEKNATEIITKQVEYSYDVFDRRIAKEVDPDGMGSATTQVERLVYDGDHIALTFDGAGTQTHRYLHGSGVDRILADETAQGQVNWALTDHQGTVRDVINSSGAIQNHITYDSFGQITNETNGTIDFRFSYTGREFDEETGQYYYRSRYYDASNGRFLSEDTIGFKAGDSNLYRYVWNNPVNLVDPSGFGGEVISQSRHIQFINGGFNVPLLGRVGNIQQVSVYPTASIPHQIRFSLSDIMSPSSPILPARSPEEQVDRNIDALNQLADRFNDPNHNVSSFIDSNSGEVIRDRTIATIKWKDTGGSDDNSTPWGGKLSSQYDQNGHIIPRNIGGDKEKFNMFAQNKSINGGGYNTFGRKLNEKLTELNRSCSGYAQLELTIELLHNDPSNPETLFETGAVLPLRPDAVEVSGQFSDNTMVSGWFTNYPGVLSRTPNAWRFQIGNDSFPR